MGKTGGDGWVTLGSRSTKRRWRKKKTKHLDQQEVQKPKYKSANTPPPMAVERPKLSFTNEVEEISKNLNRTLDFSKERVLDPIEPTPTYRSPLAVKTSDYPKNSRLCKGTATTTPTQGMPEEEVGDLKRNNVQEDGAEESIPNHALAKDFTFKADCNEDKNPKVVEVEQNANVKSCKLDGTPTLSFSGLRKASYPSSVASTAGSYSDKKEKRMESESANSSEEIKIQWIFNPKECKLESQKIDRTRTPEALVRGKKGDKSSPARVYIADGETELNPTAPSFKVKRACNINNYSTHNLATAPYHAPPVPWQPMTQPNFVPIWGRGYPAFPQIPLYNPYPQPPRKVNKASEDGRDSVLNLLLPYTSTPY